MNDQRTLAKRTSQIMKLTEVVLRAPDSDPRVRMARKNCYYTNLSLLTIKVLSSIYVCLGLTSF